MTEEQPYRIPEQNILVCGTTPFEPRGPLVPRDARAKRRRPEPKPPRQTDIFDFCDELAMQGGKAIEVSKAPVQGELFGPDAPKQTRLDGLR